MTKRHFRPLPALLALALLLLWGFSATAAMAPQPINLALEYSQADGSHGMILAEPIPYPGYEDAYWLAVSAEAQADPSASLTLDDPLGLYPGGFSIPQGVAAANYYMFDGEGALDGPYYEFYGLDAEGNSLATYRLFLSLSALEPLPPEETEPPVEPVQPVDITIQYVDTDFEPFATEIRTLQPGANTVRPDNSQVPEGYILTGQAEYTVNVTAQGADLPLVTFMYEAPVVVTEPPVQPVDITIQYVDADFVVFATEIRTLQPGANTVRPDSGQVPDGYILTGQAEYTVNVTAQGADLPLVTFMYEAPVVVTEPPVQPVDITIQYVDADFVVFATEIRTLQPGANTVRPDSGQVPEGFTLTGQAEYTVNVTAQGADLPLVTFMYEALAVVTEPPVQPVDITIQYVDADFVVFATEIRTLQPGANTVRPDSGQVPEGYTLTGQAEYTVNVTAQGADLPLVTFMYEAPVVVTEPPVQPADITIQYVDADFVVFATEIRTLQPGANTVRPDSGQVPEGYILTGQAEYTVNVTAQGADLPLVTFMYEVPVVVTEPPVQPVDITVAYLDEAGQPVADSQRKTLPAGSSLVTPSPANLQPGYELVGPASVEVWVDAQGASMDPVIFTYKLTTPVSEPVTVVISYTDAQGNPVASDTSVSLGEGKHPVSPAPLDLLEGYALAEQEDPVKYVTVTDNTAQPASLRFVYELIAEATATPAPPPKAALVSVVYKTESGVVLETLTVPCREGEDTLIPVDLGLVDQNVYQLVGESSYTITVDAAGNPSQREVVFLFKDISVITATIPVHYRDEAGAMLAPSQQLTLEAGTHQVTPSPEGLPEGYLLQSDSPVEVTLSQSGALSHEEVVFIYARPLTPSPSPSPTAEPTVLPFDITTMDRYAYPTGDAINFRSSPDSSRKDNILGTLSTKDLVHVLGMVKNHQGEDWYLAEANGQEGFLWSSVTRLLSFNEVAEIFGWTPTPSPTPTTPPDAMTDGEIIDRWAEVTAAGGVNFRARTTTSSTLLAKLAKGERFWVYTQQTVGDKVWYNIMANGKTGFVVAEYTRLFSEQESEQYQATLPSPMPYAVTPVPSAAPATTPPVTDVPSPSLAPTMSPKPATYHGPALTIRQTALRTGVSRQDEPVMEILETGSLVQVWSQTWIGDEGWSQVQVMADKQVGYVPNAALRYIDEQEAAYHLSLLQPQPTVSLSPTRQPEQRTGHSITRGQNVPLRAFPDTNAQIISLLDVDAVVAVHGQDYVAGTTWDVVQYGSTFGYVRSDQLRVLNPVEEQNYLDSLRTATPPPAATPEPVTLNSPSSYGYVSADYVRLRSSPSTSSRELKLLSRDAFALVYGSSAQNDGTWYHISQDGTVGYIHGDFFTVLPMGQLATYLQSPAYLNANAANQPAQGAYQQPGQITPLENYNATVWQNPSLINASYEPFTPLGPPPPPVEAIISPTPLTSPSPTPTLLTVEGFEEPPAEKPGGGFNGVLLAVGLLAVLGGGGYYAYHLYNQNQKRAAARAAQRRAEAARQAGQPQARPAPSPYAPPRPGMQGTQAYRPQGTPVQPTQPGQAPPSQGTQAFRPQGTPVQPAQPGQVPPTQGTQAYRPQGTPVQPTQPGQAPPSQGTQAFRPQGTPVQPTQPGQVPPSQGTPVQPAQPGQVPPTQGTQARPTQPGQAQQGSQPAAQPDARPDEPQRRRRSDRHDRG